MKSIVVLFTCCFSFVILFPSCKKDKPKTPEEEIATLIEGQIKVPIGSKIDPNSFTVQSNFSSGGVVDGAFKLKVVGSHTALFATDAKGEVAMMGYKYPGSSDYDISPSTTALGMIMMSPTVLSLSDEAKQKMITKLIEDENFSALVLEVENALTLGKSLFDTSNTSLMTAMVSLFQSVSLKKSDEEELPVNMFRAGKNIAFNNSGKAYSTIIGVYKDSKRIHKITVDGLQIVATSILDIFKGNGNTIGTPQDYNFILSEDGNYTFKFRTGKPGFDDGSAEYGEAFYRNLAHFAFNILDILTPFAELKGCKETVILNAITSFQSISELNDESNIGAILYTIYEFMQSNSSGFIDQCVDAKSVNPTYYKYAIKLMGYASKAFGVISNGANSTIFGIQWAMSKEAVDTCFNVSGNSVTGGLCDIIIDPRDGQKYKIVQIGGKIWFAENLRYSGSIPQITSSSQWSTNKTGAWSYYNNDYSNDADYGKLYNWKAVDCKCLCPPDWHVPTDAEWSRLMDSLGGLSVAGGKLKSTMKWILPNRYATNESGFSALPGGMRGGEGNFSQLGIEGDWWSSTENTEYYAWGYGVRNDVGSASRFYSNQESSGFSVRCVKD